MGGSPGFPGVPVGPQGALRGGRAGSEHAQGDVGMGATGRAGARGAGEPGEQVSQVRRCAGRRKRRGDAPPRSPALILHLAALRGFKYFLTSTVIFNIYGILGSVLYFQLCGECLVLFKKLL